MKTWIVAVNRSEARVFEYNNKQDSEVEFVMKIDNPRGRLKDREINADKPGVFSSLMGHGTRLTQPQLPKERVAQEFSIQVTEALEAALKQHQFDDLIVIAEPHFLGMLRNLFSRELKQCISREEAKDLNLSTVTRQELKDRLWPENPSFAAP